MMDEIKEIKEKKEIIWEKEKNLSRFRAENSDSPYFFNPTSPEVAAKSKELMEKINCLKAEIVDLYKKIKLIKLDISDSCAYADVLLISFLEALSDIPVGIVRYEVSCDVFDRRNDCFRTGGSNTVEYLLTTSEGAAKLPREFRILRREVVVNAGEQYNPGDEYDEYIYWNINWYNC